MDHAAAFRYHGLVVYTLLHDRAAETAITFPAVVQSAVQSLTLHSASID
jgi:hypothetical protein